MATAPPDTQSSASPLDRHQPPVAERPRRHGRSTAALIVGIIGVVVAVVIPLLGWILGIVAIVLGATARADASRRGQLGVREATIAVILGIIAIAVGIAVVVVASAVSS